MHAEIRTHKLAYLLMNTCMHIDKSEHTYMHTMRRLLTWVAERYKEEVEPSRSFYSAWNRHDCSETGMSTMRQDPLHAKRGEHSTMTLNPVVPPDSRMIRCIEELVSPHLIFVHLLTWETCAPTIWQFFGSTEALAIQINHKRLF